MKTIKGNLLDFPDGINILFHQANCHCVMGAGIAAQIKERYPAAYDADLATKGQDKLGKFSTALISGDPLKIIVNLYGQDDIGGRATNYEAIYNAMEVAMERMANSPRKEHFKFHIGIPKGMSCGLASGDWRILEVMIAVLEEKYGIPVTIVEWDK